jgi:hypothetical protein
MAVGILLLVVEGKTRRGFSHGKMECKGSSSARTINKGFQPRQDFGRFEFGSSSNQNFRSNSGAWRKEDQGFQGQDFGGGFGDFDQGSFDGNRNQYNRGNYPYYRPYRQQYNNYRPNYRGNNYRENGTRGSQNNVTREDRKSEDADTTKIGEGNSGSVPNLQFRQVVPSTDILVVERPVSAQKGVNKILCFWCENNGHYVQDCTAVLCIYCEKASHLWGPRITHPEYPIYIQFTIP